MPRKREFSIFPARFAFCRELANSAMNLPAFPAARSLLPPTVARRTRFNFTAGGCLAFRNVFVILFGPQVIANPLGGQVQYMKHVILRD